MKTKIYVKHPQGEEILNFSPSFSQRNLPWTPSFGSIVRDSTLEHIIHDYSGADHDIGDSGPLRAGIVTAATGWR